MRLAVGFTTAGCLVAAGWAVRQRLSRDAHEEVVADARRAAEVASARARDAFSSQLEDLTLTLHNAASNPRLSAAVAGRVDAATLRDLLQHEAWWRPYRDKLALTIAYAGDRPAFDQGNASTGLDLATLLKQTHDGGAWARAASTPRGLLLVAARTTADGAVMLATRPADPAVIGALAHELEAAMVLTHGRSVWTDAGDEGDRTLLRSLMLEGAARAGTKDDLVWDARDLAPGATLWIGARPSRAATERLWRDRSRANGVLVAASVLACFSVAGGAWPARRRRAAALQGRGGATALLAPPAEGMFGRYRLVERIAEGGMAEIHTAVSFGTSGFRRPFAIKRLRPEMLRNPQAIAQFIDEANLQSTLIHPNIVPVFDFGQIDGEYFIAQEYVQGRDVGRLTRRLVERGEPMLPPPAVLAIAHDMLAALHFAHTRHDDAGRPLELVHRDVTPDNVLVSSLGEVKLLDFGIVKAATGRVTQTDIGLVKGNVDFMSPEQARGRAVDARSDVFSAALVLFFCSTGAMLYPGGTLFDRLVQAANGPGPDELAKLEELPELLRDLLQVALAIDPRDRFSSAEEMRALVAPHVGDGAVVLANTVAHLFGDELRAEADRLASVTAPTMVAREMSPELFGTVLPRA